MCDHSGMFGWWRRRHRRLYLRIIAGPVPAGATFTVTMHRGQITMATLQLQDNQHCPLSIQAVDAAGNPVALPTGSVSWSSSNTSVASVVPSADGMSCDVAAAGALGAAQVGVSVVVDANTTLTGSLDVSVGAGAAATIQIVPGTPVAK